MAPFGASKASSMVRNRTNDSSLASSYFNKVKSIDDSSSGSLKSMNFEEETFSVQTPSVNEEESAATFSMDSDPYESTNKQSATLSTYETNDDTYGETTASFDATSVNTPSVTSVETPSIQSSGSESELVSVSASVSASIQSPSVQSGFVNSVVPQDTRSVQTPSIQDENEFEDGMDQSAFGSVIDSVIHSIIGKRNTSGRKSDKGHQTSIQEEDEDFAEEGEYNEESLADKIVEEEYDDFMNEFSNQSVDIMRKRSTGLINVMSAVEEENLMDQYQSEDEDDDRDPIEFNKNNDYVTYSNPSTSIPATTSAANQSKTAKDMNRASRGLNGRGRVAARSPSPSPLKSKSSIFSLRKKNKDDASIAFSIDSSQPSADEKVAVHTTRNRFAKRGVGNVYKKDMDQRREIELLLSEKRYAEMLEMIHENPKLLAIQSNQPSGKTFLHVMASMSIPPSENIILKVVSVDTSLVTVTDNNNNSPLHYAAQHVRKGNMHAFTVLLKFHPMGASERNSDGDLPLHIVASNPARGAEEAAHLLLETNPKAISEPNNKGKIPLHLALSEGSRNLKLLMKIIKLHKFRKSGVDIVDNKGKYLVSLSYYDY